ncbi:MAG TPA: hypothetical protein VIY86_06745, partial [Pirellulaceae bacterium]
EPIHLPMDHVEELVIALRAGRGSTEANKWEAVIGFRLTRDGVLGSWREAFEAADQTSSGRLLRRLGGKSVLVVARPRPRLIVGARLALQELIDSQGQPPRLRRDLERLRLETDTQRQLTVLFAPSYLLGDGQSALGQWARVIQGPVELALEEGCPAALVTLAWKGDESYLELRAIPTWEFRRNVEVRWRKQWASLGPSLASRLSEGPPLPEYWRAFAQKVPAMLRFTGEHTRWGWERGQLIVNASLPVEAIHNLALGVIMAGDLALGPRETGGPPIAR